MKKKIATTKWLRKSNILIKIKEKKKVILNCRVSSQKIRRMHIEN